MLSRDLATTAHIPRRPPAHLSPLALIEHQLPPSDPISGTPSLSRHGCAPGASPDISRSFLLVSVSELRRFSFRSLFRRISVLSTSASSDLLSWWSCQRRLVRIDTLSSDQDRLSPCAEPLLHSGHRCHAFEVVDTGERTQEHLWCSMRFAGTRSLIRDETGPLWSAPEATLDRVIAPCSPIRADKSQE